MNRRERIAHDAHTRAVTNGEQQLGCVTVTKEEERRQAGTPAALEENIDNAIEGRNGTGGQQRAQAYPIRWLVSHHAISPAFAAVIAAELGMGGAS